MPVTYFCNDANMVFSNSHELANVEMKPSAQSHTALAPLLFLNHWMNTFKDGPDTPFPPSESSVYSVPPYPDLLPGDTVDLQKIARPPNAWILYRSSKIADFKKRHPHIYDKETASNRGGERGNRPTQANMSKAIAEMWNNEASEVKDHYHREAIVKSMIHQVENPGMYPNFYGMERNLSLMQLS